MDKYNDVHSPLYKRLIKRNKHLSFHTPGHKNGSGFSEEFITNIMNIDVTEIKDTDDLHEPTGIILEAHNKAEKSFGADKSFMLVNGATVGIHTMVGSVCNSGDKLLVSRNAHKSIWAAMALFDVKPIFIKPYYDFDIQMSTQISCINVSNILQKNKDIKGIFIVNPTYYGLCTDIKSISDIAGNYDIPLLVDEAHGTHFTFSKLLPDNASVSGADMWVNSAHKTLPSLTQSAWLHTKNKYSKKAKKILSMLETSSPSYILMASLDYAREFMENNGEHLIEILKQKIENIVKRLQVIGYNIPDYTNNDEVFDVDFTRLVIEYPSVSGYDLYEKLYDKGICAEMADSRRVVFIITVIDAINKDNPIEKLYDILEENSLEIINKIPYKLINFDIPLPEMHQTPRQAMLCDSEYINIKNANKRISTGIVGAYPPGIPIVGPGEEFSKDIIDILLSIKDMGGRLFGIDENGNVEVSKL